MKRVTRSITFSKWMFTGAGLGFQRVDTDVGAEWCRRRSVVNTSKGAQLMEYEITRCEARLVRERIEVPGEIPQCFGSPRDVVRCAWSLIGDRADECFLTIAIDARHQPVSYQMFTNGAPAHCGVDTGAVARFALMTGACAVVIAHNHPSGDVQPSPSDDLLTEHVAAALAVVQRHLLDHVIVGSGDYYSYEEWGRMKPREHYLAQLGLVSAVSSG